MGAAVRPEPVEALAPPRNGGVVEEFLQRLARAVQQFHTYPATSPLCQSAVENAQRALSILEHRDQIAFRVTPYELVVDENPFGGGGTVGHELARRLHAASIAEVTIDHAATARELARFCSDLVASDDRTRERAPLAEMLVEHGVERIAVRVAYRPEVLQVGRPDAPITGVIQQQQRRREEMFASSPGAVNHLYPPDKGWVRLDPASPLSSVSLVDLPLLTEDPAALAAMLLRLTDGESFDGLTNEDALAQKFSDVTTLFAALDPRIARMMFSRLSRAVLDLPPERRQELLRRTILPGLLDGRLEGGVLREFPDIDLAESLCLLLDLETAAPQVVTTAFARLELPAERQATLMPLLESKLQERSGAPRADTSVDAHARRLLSVDASKSRSFAEFAAFDLALDEETTEALTRIREGIASTNSVVVQLECLWKLIRLEPNPDAVQRFFDRASAMLDVLERQGAWTVVASWLSRCRELAGAVAETRPDVADALATKLSGLCTPDRAARLVALGSRDDEGRRTAGAIVNALGAAIAPVLVQNVHAGTRDNDTPRKAAIAMLTDNAALVAPALVDALGRGDAETNRTIVRVLGLAGRGYETAIASQLGSADESTVREALRSLARIGTAQAAALVCAEVEKNRGWLGPAAEETLWRFPAVEAHRQVTTLLARREFVVKHPLLAGRLLDRAAQAGAAGLKPVAAALVPLRYRVWNPQLVKLARKAHTLAAS